MKQLKLYLLITLLVFFFVSGCKKVESAPPVDDDIEIPEGMQLNKYINAINKLGEKKFILTVNNEVINEDVIKGNYSLIANDGASSLIAEGKLILYKDNDQFKDGKLLLVTKVHKIEPHAKKKISFDATQVAMNFLFEKGDFNYSGFPNRSKLAASGKDVVPGLFYSANPPVLSDFSIETEDKNYKVIHSTEKGLSLIINEIELLNKAGATVKLKDVTLSINPTFDILCQFEPMSEVERNSYFQAMKDNDLITNIAVVKDLIPSKAKKLGVISYTDFDFYWETVLNYKGNEHNKGDSKKLFKMSHTLMVGPVPIVLTTKGSLRYEYTANVEANITLTNDIKLDLIAGSIYDFQSEKSEKIGHSSLNNSTSSSQLLAVSANGKIYYDQEVEIKVLGLVGPTFRLSPGIGSEMHYHQETGKPLYQNFGVYVTPEIDYAVKLSTFFWKDISIKTSEVHLGEQEFGRNYIYKLPAKITIVDGDKQTGAALSPLLEPVKVKITDSKGNPLTGITVEFIPQGGGSVADQFITTDNEGFASTMWSPGYPENMQAKLIAQLTYYFEGHSLQLEYISTEFNAVVTKPKPIDPSGYSYKTVQLGNRLWTSENYKYGGITWDNNEAYGRFFGGYNPLNEVPKYWRLPTAKEYQDLINSLGNRAYEILTAKDGFNGGPFGFITIEFSGNSVNYSNSELNKKAIFLTSDRDGDRNVSWAKALYVDFNTKQAYIGDATTTYIGYNRPGYHYVYNVRLILNE